MSHSQPKETSPSARSVFGLNGLVFCLSDVRHGIGPLLTIYLKNVLHWDPERIGLALAMPDVTALLFQVPAGVVADETKRKKTYVASACLCILIACVFILALPSFWLILTAQLFMGLAISFIAPLLGAITLGLFGKARFPKRVSLNEVFNHSGNVVSALLAGLTGYLFGSHWVFYWVMVFAMGALFFLTRIGSSEINYRIARELPADETTQPLPIKTLIDHRIIIFNLFLVIYYIANGSQMVLIGQKVSESYPEQSSLFIAGCMLVAELTMIAISFGMGFAIYRFARKTLFLTAFTMLPIRAFLFTVIDNPLYLIGIQSLDGIAAGIMAITIPVINTDLGFQTGRFNFLQGISALSISLGVIISMILGGFLAKIFGYQLALLTLSTIAVFGLVFSFFIFPYTKRHHR
jgi:MFS family permease